MKDFRTLQVWQKAHSFTLLVYRITKNFPSEERFGISSQMRRSSSSIPTNIAEGCGRDTNRDFQRFLQIAYGSANEVDYQIILSADLNYVSPEARQELSSNIAELKRMLAALIRKVSADR